MNRYRIEFHETSLRYCVIEAESESAARQAFIDHDTLIDQEIEVVATEVKRVDRLADRGPERYGVHVGDRVRLLANMVNNESSVLPREKGMVAGLEGTVDWLGELNQIGVRWDNGSRLMLLVGHDQWERIEHRVMHAEVDTTELPNHSHGPDNSEWHT